MDTKKDLRESENYAEKIQALESLLQTHSKRIDQIATSMEEHHKLNEQIFQEIKETISLLENVIGTWDSTLEDQVAITAALTRMESRFGATLDRLSSLIRQLEEKIERVHKD